MIIKWRFLGLDKHYADEANKLYTTVLLEECVSGDESVCECRGSGDERLDDDDRLVAKELWITSSPFASPLDTQRKRDTKANGGQNSPRPSFQ